MCWPFGERSANCDWFYDGVFYDGVLYDGVLYDGVLYDGVFYDVVFWDTSLVRSKFYFQIGWKIYN